MKINGKEVSVNVAHNEMLEKSLGVRPCSYDPTPHFEPRLDATGALIGFGLSVESKRLWFATYCQEKNLEGQIIPEMLENGFKLIETLDGPRYYLSAKADVFIDGKLVGTGISSHCIPQTDAKISWAYRSVTEYAISNALSNAGFGLVDFVELASPSVSPTTGPGSAPENVGSTEGLPFHDGGESATTANPTSPASASAPAAPATENNTPAPDQQAEMKNLFAQLGGVDDELTRAKQVIFPAALRITKYTGKVLGEVPKPALDIIVKSKRTEPEVLAAQKAAKLLIKDWMKASGKAIK